jgi:serpin B
MNLGSNNTLLFVMFSVNLIVLKTRFTTNVMKNNLLLSLTLTFFLLSCQEEPTEIKELPNLPEKSAQLINADNSFGFQLFKKVTSNEKEVKNITISPLSVSMALSMAYNGAKNETKVEIEKVLNVSGLTTEQINNSHKALVEALKSYNPDVKLEIANAIYSDKNFSVLPDFIATNQSYYDAFVQSLDFGNSAEALKIINGWVAQKTHDKIPTIINEIDPQMVMILLNAIYFNGIWKNKFGEKDTHNLPFYFADGTQKDVATMKLEKSLEYYSNNMFSAVNLPYGNGQFQMTVILPNKEKTTQNIISELTTDNWNKWIKSFSNKTCVVSMPRFKFSFDTELKNILSNIGMTSAFSPQKADFTGINPDKTKQLYIDQVVHKTYIDVNESGTEAAAVTAIIILTGSSGEPDPRKFFTVNRPFIFTISEKTTGSILFIGEIRKPEY